MPLIRAIAAGWQGRFQVTCLWQEQGHESVVPQWASCFVVSDLVGLDQRPEVFHHDGVINWRLALVHQLEGIGVPPLPRELCHESRHPVEDTPT